MIYDVFTYNGELSVLKLHLNITSPFVDKYIIIEANQTFSGHPKPLYFFQQQRFVQPFWGRINYHVINDWDDEDRWELARKSPNTQGAAHWKREFYMKESIHDALEENGVQDDDLCLIGDVDEIWEGDPEAKEFNLPAKLKLKVYSYYLNNRSNEQFWGTYAARYKDFKGKILNHERSRTDIRTQEEHGWHFTSMGGLKEVQRKLNDSYTQETYNTARVQELLPSNHRNRLDFLGRDFTFKLSEDEWPTYLKENKHLYKPLIYEEKYALTNI